MNNPKDQVKYDPYTLLLNRTWCIGSYESHTDKKWIPKVLYEVNSIGLFWDAAQNTFYNSIYSLTKSEEIWIFEKDILPTYEDVDKLNKKRHYTKVVDITLSKIKMNNIIAFILDIIGESMVHSGRIFGIRIKPNSFGCLLKFWLSDNIYNSTEELIDAEHNTHRKRHSNKIAIKESVVICDIVKHIKNYSDEINHKISYYISDINP
jgi:hypothetical protein